MTRTVFSINTDVHMAGPLVGLDTTLEIARALRDSGADAQALANDISEGRVRLHHTAAKVNGEMPAHRCQWHQDAIDALISYSGHCHLIHAWEAKDRADWLLSGLASGALALLTPDEALALS